MRSLASLVGIAFGAILASGCYSHDDPYYYYDDGYSDNSYCAPGLTQSTIDTGTKLDIDPGVGAGVTAEYFGDGAWRFATACDTINSNYPCTWDILVSALDGKIEGFASESLERNDLLDWAPSTQNGPNDAARLVATNDYDLDAFTLDATPDTTLEIDVILDDYCGGDRLRWWSRGNVANGKTQTTDLTPSDP